MNKAALLIATAALIVSWSNSDKAPPQSKSERIIQVNSISFVNDRGTVVGSISAGKDRIETFGLGYVSATQFLLVDQSDRVIARLQRGIVSGAMLTLGPADGRSVELSANGYNASLVLTAPALSEVRLSASQTSQYISIDRSASSLPGAALMISDSGKLAWKAP